MKNKKVLWLLFLIILSLVGFSGCKKRYKYPEDVVDYIKAMKSYETKVEMYVKNDKQELKYDMKQYCDASIGYRLEIGQDRVQVHKDNKIYVTDNKNSSKYELDSNFDELYKISFIGEYIKLLYTNDEVKFTIENLDGNEYELIETILPGKNRNLNRAVMYINLKNYNPVKILIYDEDDKERVNITYKDFKRDIALSKDLFKTE
jgi:outer membrane lipoprotein-sorting protein